MRNYSKVPSIPEALVPTPIHSGRGQIQFNAPSAISFVPATTKLATPETQGTLMADSAADPKVLRDRDDMLGTKSFIDLAITQLCVLASFNPFPPFTHLCTQWPGFAKEWITSMANVIQDRDCISHAELARFVMDQFILFANARTAFHQQVAGTDLPGLIILDHGCKPMFKS